MGMYALALNALVSSIYSIFLPKFVKITSTRFVFFTTQLIANVCYFLFLFRLPVYVPFIITALIGNIYIQNLFFYSLIFCYFIFCYLIFCYFIFFFFFFLIFMKNRVKSFNFFDDSIFNCWK
jgi:hypothetical protein